MARPTHEPIDLREALLKGALAGLVGGSALILLRAIEERYLLSERGATASYWQRVVRRQARRLGIRLSPRGALATSAAMELAYAALVGAAYGTARTRKHMAPALQLLLDGALAAAVVLPTEGVIPRQRSLKRGVKRRMKRFHVDTTPDQVRSVSDALVAGLMSTAFGFFAGQPKVR